MAEEQNCEECTHYEEWIILNINGKPWPKYPDVCQECSYGPFVTGNHFQSREAGQKGDG